MDYTGRIRRMVTGAPWVMREGDGALNSGSDAVLAMTRLRFIPSNPLDRCHSAQTDFVAIPRDGYPCLEVMEK